MKLGLFAKALLLAHYSPLREAYLQAVEIELFCSKLGLNKEDVESIKDIAKCNPYDFKTAAYVYLDMDMKNNAHSSTPT